MTPPGPAGQEATPGLGLGRPVLPFAANTVSAADKWEQRLIPTPSHLHPPAHPPHREQRFQHRFQDERLVSSFLLFVVSIPRKYSTMSVVRPN